MEDSIPAHYTFLAQYSSFLVVVIEAIDNSASSAPIY
jgi:hypothetical protein